MSFLIKKLTGRLAKLSELIVIVFISYFVAYLFISSAIFGGLRVQFRYLLANLRKLYVIDEHMTRHKADCTYQYNSRLSNIHYACINNKYMSNIAINVT